jgi:phosphohistidine phosphatase
MELFFLRHGIAEAREDFPFARDFDRPLTPEGVRKLRRIAKALKTVDTSFGLVLSSPLVRARQTAEIIVKELGLEAVLKFSPVLKTSSSPRRLVRGLLQRQLPERVLLVGHEPLFSSTIALLLCGHPNLSITLKKGGLAKLTVDKLEPERCAVLEWLLTPRQLCQMR